MKFTSAVSLFSATAVLAAPAPAPAASELEARQFSPLNLVNGLLDNVLDLTAQINASVIGIDINATVAVKADVLHTVTPLLSQLTGLITGATQTIPVPTKGKRQLPGLGSPPAGLPASGLLPGATKAVPVPATQGKRQLPGLGSPAAGLPASGLLPGATKAVPVPATQGKRQLAGAGTPAATLAPVVASLISEVQGTIGNLVSTIGPNPGVDGLVEPLFSALTGLMSGLEGVVGGLISALNGLGLGGLLSPVTSYLGGGLPGSAM